MKLIIDIPEDYYKAIKEIPVEQSTADMMIIQNGILLDQELCNDVISRQAAIDAIQTLIDNILHHFEVTAGVEKRRYNECLRIIRELPPVTPTEKVGKWVYNKNLSTHYGDLYVCSECGERCLESCYERIEKLPDFCPKCHTKMEVKE